MNQTDWMADIGLEIHAQVLTESKIFSSEPNRFGGGDNEFTHPVSLGMPGTLPVLNLAAVEMAMLVGLGFECEIQKHSVFARKNYFYPDLAKGYQISQYDQPICQNGVVEFYHDGEIKKVRLERIHMEEDAGKTIHHGEYSLINYNRAGVPLLEIVSKPEMHTPQEAAQYARMVRQVLIYLGACDGNLEEGSMRCDCNVSVRKKGDTKLGTRVELKNINSFRFVEKAIEYEISRQIDQLESGELLIQETRLYDSTKNRTFSMRTKEEAQDYRYFPDPDLLPVTVTETMLKEMKSKLVEMPMVRLKRFQDQYGLNFNDAQILTDEKALSDFFESACQTSKNPKETANWVLSEVLREVNESKQSLMQSKLSAENFGKLVALVASGHISGKMGKVVFKEMWIHGKPPEAVIKEKGLAQISDDTAIEKIIEEVLAENPAQVAEFKAGKTKVMGFLIGQIMKRSRGQANPDVVNRILKDKLK